MDLSNRPLALDPYEALPPVPSFTLTSKDLEDGGKMPLAQSAEGDNTSPHLAWTGFPAETKSFVVTCFDPDAPTPSGFWHWIVMDVPLEITELPTGAGESDLTLDSTAFHGRADSGQYAYYGALPPQGDRPHRYVFAVHALDVDTLGLSEDATPAAIAFNTLFHTVARARLTVTYQR